MTNETQAIVDAKITLETLALQMDRISADLQSHVADVDTASAASNEAGLALLVFAVGIALVYGLTVWRTWGWKPGVESPALKGLAIPEGSIRGILAFSVIWSFIIFIFFGKCIPCIDDDEFIAVLTAFGTLTGAVTGFYFGGRSTQPKLAEQPPSDNPTISSLRTEIATDFNELDISQRDQFLEQLRSLIPNPDSALKKKIAQLAKPSPSGHSETLIKVLALIEDRNTLKTLARYIKSKTN